jgi:protocatechuate 3,4-dioxygenase beta subunit
MNRCLAAALVLLAASTWIPCFGQEQTTSSYTSSIRGTVVDGRTSQPLDGATVVLRGLQGAGAGGSTTTAADGGFAFRGLAPGRYRLTASRNGYLDSNARGMNYGPRGFGAMMSVNAGQEVGDIVLRLTLPGVISGRVTNERDEPMAGVLVQTMKSSYREGQRNFSDTRTGFTDEKGEFRIAGLTPGQYYIKATNPRNWGKGHAPAQVYVPTFYPGVADPSQIQPVALSAGEELNGVNLGLTPSKAVHVKGKVVTESGAPAKGAQLTLSQFGGNGSVIEGEADAAGKFDMAAVPPGSYVLTAQLQENADTGRSLTGRANISVGDTSLEAGDVVVFSGATVSGRVRVDGDHKVNLARSMASLKPLASSDGGDYVGSTQVQSDGSFVFHDVPEGSYRTQISSLPDGYYLRTTDAELGVVVSHGRGQGVEARIASGAGRILGTVYKDNDHQEAAASVRVVLVPDATRRSNNDFYRETMTDRSGRFSLAGISPGDYSFFAFDGVGRDEYMDPTFIQRNEDAGKALRVEEGSNLSLQLQLAIQASDSP